VIRAPESVCPWIRGPGWKNSNPDLGSATLSVTNKLMFCFAAHTIFTSLLCGTVQLSFLKRRYDVSHASLRPSLIVPMLLSLSLSSSFEDLLRVSIIPVFFLDENPYKCSQCTKTFAKPVSLKIHMTSHNKQKALLSRARPRKKKTEDEESWRPESEAMGREDEETASCAVSSSEEKEKEEEKQEQDQKEELSRRTSACKYRGCRRSVADPNPDPRICMFLGPLDPDREPLVRVMDPDPSITGQK
jgi:hypothetical protein